MKLGISNPNRSEVNCDFVFVANRGLILRIKTSETELRTDRRTQEKKQKTDGRQTPPQRGSSGFYWQRQNLVRKVLSGCRWGAEHARPRPRLKDCSLCLRLRRTPTGSICDDSKDQSPLFLNAVTFMFKISSVSYRLITPKEIVPHVGKLFAHAKI